MKYNSILDELGEFKGGIDRFQPIWHAWAAHFTQNSSGVHMRNPYSQGLHFVTICNSVKVRQMMCHSIVDDLTQFLPGFQMI